MEAGVGGASGWKKEKELDRMVGGEQGGGHGHHISWLYVCVGRERLCERIWWHGYRAKWTAAQLRQSPTHPHVDISVCVCVSACVFCASNHGRTSRATATATSTTACVCLGRGSVHGSSISHFVQFSNGHFLKRISSPPHRRTIQAHTEPPTRSSALSYVVRAEQRQ